jgi:hypothetical protein
LVERRFRFLDRRRHLPFEDSDLAATMQSVKQEGSDKRRRDRPAVGRLLGECPLELWSSRAVRPSSTSEKD